MALAPVMVILKDSLYLKRIRLLNIPSEKLWTESNNVLYLFQNNEGVTLLKWRQGWP